MSDYADEFYANEFYANEETRVGVLGGDNRNADFISFQPPILNYRAPVAQLVERRVIMREVVSSTPTGPTLRVLK